MTEAQPQFRRVMVADLSPGRVRNRQSASRLVRETAMLAWITNAAEPVHSEFRDDRFTAAFDRTHDSASVFTVAYVVRAVSPGRYVLPQATVEDMYRPDRFARTGTGTIEVTSAK